METCRSWLLKWYKKDEHPSRMLNLYTNITLPTWLL
jgi:hypothetical protein